MTDHKTGCRLMPDATAELAGWAERVTEEARSPFQAAQRIARRLGVHVVEDRVQPGGAQFPTPAPMADGGFAVGRTLRIPLALQRDSSVLRLARRTRRQRTSSVHSQYGGRAGCGHTDGTTHSRVAG